MQRVIISRQAREPTMSASVMVRPIDSAVSPTCMSSKYNFLTSSSKILQRLLQFLFYDSLRYLIPLLARRFIAPTPSQPGAVFTISGIFLCFLFNYSCEFVF
jgi:hypothetical protein